MANKIKGYQRAAEACERRWNTAMRYGYASEAYAASHDYEKNIKAQDEELKKMDPNSHEYEKAERSLEEQRGNSWEMDRQQRDYFSGEEKKQAYQELGEKNNKISRDMTKAVERGDSANYDSLREQYEKNISSKEQLGKQMKEEGVEFTDTVYQEKVDLHSHDVDMCSKINEKVSEKESKGKSVSEEDRIEAEKYSKQMKQSEADLLKYQNDKEIESMRERGASESAIKSKEEENDRFQRSL